MKEITVTLTDARSENDMCKSHSESTEMIAGSPASKICFTPPTVELINSIDPSAVVDIRNAAMAVQTSAQQTYINHKDLVINLVKGFIDELNDKIRLGAHPYNSGIRKSDREYYGISIEDSSYPDTNTYIKLQLVVKNLINGEKNRIAGGGPALVAFTWQDLEEWNTLLIAKRKAKVNSFNDTKDKQKEVTKMVKKFCNEIYPEMKADAISFYRNEEKETFRRLAAEFGILFRETGYDETVYGYVFGVITNDGVPLRDAVITADDSDIKIKSNKSGYWSSYQFKLGKHTFRCNKFPFDELISENVELKQGIEKELNFEFISED